MDNSFDENDSIDLASVVAELREGDDGNRNAPPKKNLSDVFDGCMANGGMKVYLRVRPIKSKEEGTITVESDTSIVTNAPESSKRAQYTKTEARHYVSSLTANTEINAFFSTIILSWNYVVDFLSCIWWNLSPG